MGDRKEQFAVDVGDRWRLVFKPDHNPMPRLQDGSINIMEVTAILVLEVINYH